jgi:alpha-1,3-fucosyltransferase 10
MGRILVWNDDWNGARAPRSLGIPGWTLERDRRVAVEADAIVFHLPTLELATMPRGRRPGQRWVAWSQESEVNYPLMADRAFMARFDLTMTHRRDADVWTPYVPHVEALLAPPAAKTEVALAVYMASNANDRSGRDAYVRELMRHVAVDRYGRQPGYRRIANDDGRAAKLRTIARYRFTLAFENSIARDYVTEKFYDALCAGSVPVVLGAPEVADFAPAPDAFLDVRDFADPAALAARMRALAADAAAYDAMLAWKARGPSPSFAALAGACAEDPWTRLARRL